jgi:hypothetical protein
LAGLKNLKSLHIYLESWEIKADPKIERVTDAGLEHLKDLKELEELNLMGQKITDAGLQHLQGLKQLRVLYLGQSRVTPAGEAALKAKLPKLKFE